MFELKSVNILYTSVLKYMVGCSNKQSHCDGSFEYPQHMIWLENKNNKFQLRTLTLSFFCSVNITYKDKKVRIELNADF